MTADRLERAAEQFADTVARSIAAQVERAVALERDRHDAELGELRDERDRHDAELAELRGDVVAFGLRVLHLESSVYRESLHSVKVEP